MDVSEQYQYEPLPGRDSIRIIALAPGHGDSPIICSLKTLQHSDIVGQYECISYAWGDPATVVDIICDDNRPPTTQSLRDALRRFQHVEEKRVLWADGECILSDTVCTYMV
jgi:hypothetical protein